MIINEGQTLSRISDSSKNIITCTWYWRQQETYYDVAMATLIYSPPHSYEHNLDSQSSDRQCYTGIAL